MSIAGGDNRRQPSFPIKNWNKYDDVINNEQLTNNPCESFNASWAGTMERRPSLYDVLDAIKRKEVAAQNSMREDACAVGGNNIDQQKTRVLKQNSRKADLISICKNINRMPLKLYVETIAPWIAKE